MSVVIVGNKGHEGVREAWEGDNWSDGCWKYRDRRGSIFVKALPRSTVFIFFL